jgi:hypothetical protein
VYCSSVVPGAPSTALSLVLLGAVAAASAARAQPVPAVVTQCWEDVRLFDSLAAGTFDYCRGHLRYVPGALDCYRLIDRVCLVYLPMSGELTDARYPRARYPFACPDGPAPPVCRRLDLK